MEKWVESLMETMHGLGSTAVEIRAAVESYAPAPPVPEKAFPESFYLPKPVVVEEVQPQRFYTEKEANRLWKPYTPPENFSQPNIRLCVCGHRYSEHLPCCVYLTQGCECQEYHPLNASVEGA